MKCEILATQIVQDFNRRGIAPDWVKEVNQGFLRLWRINNNLIAELYIGSDNGISIPGTIRITGGSLYINTSTPQEIADDLMVENKLGSSEVELINAMPIQGAISWLTTVDIEEQYGLPKGSVRRDIHRGKFQKHELKKVGRDWTVNMASADKLYSKREK